MSDQANRTPDTRRRYAGLDDMNRPGGIGPGRKEIGHGPGRPVGPGGMMFASRERAKNTMGTLRRIWSYLSVYKLRLFLVFLLSLLSSLGMIGGTYLIGLCIDKFIASGLTGELGVMLLMMAGLYIVCATGVWLQSIVMAVAASRAIQAIRRDLFSKIQNLPMQLFDSRTHGELMSRLSNDVDNINATLSHAAMQLFSSAISILGTLAAMLIISPVLTAVSLVLAPCVFIVTRIITARTRKFFREQQEELAQLNGFVEETISGQRVVKAFSREQIVLDEYTQINQRLREAGTRAQIFSGVVGPVMNAVNNVSYAVVAATAGLLVASGGGLTIGLATSYLNYQRQFGRPVNEIAGLYNTIQSALAGAERVFELMDETPEPADPPDAYVPERVDGLLEFIGVQFSYTGRVPVLHDFTFTAQPGQTIALVGPTGAGKTTVVNLLTRFYDISDGSIRIDGRDIKDFKRDALRGALGIVLQNTYLFTGTIRENIRYGRLHATDSQVEAAARVAKADSFIRRLPQGYDTPLTDAGGNLSQGQRQLISIARAVLADPAILILDEATSNVDTRTEVYIQQAMSQLMKSRTSLVIAHRLSTIRGADNILVVNNGRIVERGSHQTLLELDGFYANLYKTQLRNLESGLA